MSAYLLAFIYRVVFQNHTNFMSLHISNFAITGIIISLEMFRSVKQGEYSKVRLRNLLLTVVVINIVVELINLKDVQLLFGVTLANFNTADPVDAVFGVLAAGLFLVVVQYCTAPGKRKIC